LLVVTFWQTVSHHNSEHKIDQDMKLKTHDGLSPTSSKNGVVMTKIPSFPFKVGVERIIKYWMLKNSKLSLILTGCHFIADDVDIHLIAHSWRELRDGSKILAKSTTFKIVTFCLLSHLDELFQTTTRNIRLIMTWNCKLMMAWFPLHLKLELSWQKYRVFLLKSA